MRAAREAWWSCIVDSGGRWETSKARLLLGGGGGGCLVS